MRQTKTHTSAYLMLVLQSVLYGFGDPISKAAYAVMPVCSLLAVRYLIALVFLLSVAGRKIVRELRQLSSMAWLPPSLCIALSYLLSNLALKYTAATSVAFLRAMPTVMTPLLAWIVFRKRFHWLHAVIQCCSVVGLYLLCCFGGLGGFGLGEMLSLFAALLMAGALLFGEKAMAQMSAVTLAAIQTATSAVVAALACFLFEGGVQLASATWTVWGIILYLAVTCTALGYLLQNHALRRISAKSVALTQCICPVLTAAFSYLLLRERLSFAGFVGSGIIIVCVVVEILASGEP